MSKRRRGNTVAIPNINLRYQNFNHVCECVCVCVCVFYDYKGGVQQISFLWIMINFNDMLRVHTIKVSPLTW